MAFHLAHMKGQSRYDGLWYTWQLLPVPHFFDLSYYDSSLCRSAPDTCPNCSSDTSSRYTALASCCPLGLECSPLRYLECLSLFSFRSLLKCDFIRDLLWTPYTKKQHSLHPRLSPSSCFIPLHNTSPPPQHWALLFSGFFHLPSL